MHKALSVFGIGIGSLLCLLAVTCVIALSVFMNGYFAFGRLGGDVATVAHNTQNIAPLVAAAVVAAIDVLKAFAPVFAARAIANRKYVYVLASLVLLAGGMSLSMLAAYGLIMEQRSGVTSERVAQLETKSSLETQLTEARARITALGFVRPAAAIQAELAAQRQHYRWTSSKGCTDATVRASRQFCTTYNEREAELAKAQTLEQDQARVGRLTKALDAITAAGGVKAADPQLQSLATVTGFNKTNLEVGMLLLIAVMIEFVSAFGLYLALGHGPKPVSRQAPTPVSRPVATRRDTPRPRRDAVDLETVAVNDEPESAAVALAPPDTVEVFARYGVACLERAQGTAVPLTDLYTDYQSWCRTQGETPMNQRQFRETIKHVAEHVDAFAVGTRNRKQVLLDMQLRKRLAAA